MSYYVNPHHHQCVWHPYAELFGSPNIKWCEETLCHWISEPVNAYSSGAFIIAAVYLAWRSYRFRQTELSFFAPAMLAMGAFSFLYHMSNNYLFQALDFLGMFILISWMVVLNGTRLNWLGKKAQAPWLVGLCAISLILMHVMRIFFIKYQLLIAVGVLAVLATEWLASKNSERKINYRFYSAGCALVAAAGLASLLDISRALCDPSNHWFQGHALAHVLSALGLIFLYHHYEQFQFSEQANIDYDIDEIETQLEV